MKSLRIIFTILVVGSLIVLIISYSISPKPKEEILDLEQIVWRQPKSSEKKGIENAFSYDEDKFCKNVYVKDIGNKTLIIACAKGDKWVYYMFNVLKQNLILSEDTSIVNLTPPEDFPEIETKEKVIPKSHPAVIPAVTNKAR